jgi:hypothetical protein
VTVALPVGTVVLHPRGRSPAPVRVALATTPGERERGLAGVPHLPPGTGMLFVFPRPGRWRFWMRGTLIPLDLVFLGEDGHVLGIVAAAPPGSLAPLGGFPGTRLVLEIPAGQAASLGLAPGDPVEIRGPAGGGPAAPGGRLAVPTCAAAVGVSDCASNIPGARSPVPSPPGGPMVVPLFRKPSPTGPAGYLSPAGSPTYIPPAGNVDDGSVNDGGHMTMPTYVPGVTRSAGYLSPAGSPTYIPGATRPAGYSSPVGAPSWLPSGYLSPAGAPTWRPSGDVNGGNVSDGGHMPMPTYIPGVTRPAGYSSPVGAPTYLLATRPAGQMIGPWATWATTDKVVTVGVGVAAVGGLGYLAYRMVTKKPAGKPAKKSSRRSR